MQYIMIWYNYDSKSLFTQCVSRKAFKKKRQVYVARVLRKRHSVLLLYSLSVGIKSI